MATFTLAARVDIELDIRKSRFIGIVMPVADRAAALHEIDRMRQAHPNATHVCWALMAGGQSGMSDDGEPSGTAGRPMLEVLRHHELDGALAMVVRYYGGIKLGAGGLVRAYTDAIATALKQAQRIERVAMAELDIGISYAAEPQLRHWLAQHKYQLLDSRHDTLVHLLLRLPAADLDQAEEAIRRVASNASIKRSI
ncbi:IMPACT family protein [Herbaspirillum sp. alder98]|uniref:IMPACT family protein n=1 Tax=Herbaspirillum sp. alder98 TaxID=2913096 RepID=UPI001CD90E86|nr:YigZ family protein [Herbaspirillum sp. alder98]MCA1323336.1 IMPACT family protein [Herbaspirillum sp. alder98]